MNRNLIAWLALALALVAQPALAAYSKTVCMQQTAGANATLTLSTSAPTWNNADNLVTIWGAGGGGFVGNAGDAGSGGAAGSYTFLLNATLSATNTYRVGQHNGVASSAGATWLCSGTANCATITGTAVIASVRGGTSGTGTIGPSGSLSNAVPLVNALIGGDAGNGGTAKGGGGGGAAGGPSGVKANGSTGVVSSPFFGAGATGNGGVGGAGGATVSASGANGATAFTCDATLGDIHGAIGVGGGGAGGNISGSLNGGAGGAFAAGGGGAFNGGTAGNGGDGVMVLQWNPVGSNTGHAGLLLLGVGQ